MANYRQQTLLVYHWERTWDVLQWMGRTVHQQMDLELEVI